MARKATRCSSTSIPTPTRPGPAVRASCSIAAVAFRASRSASRASASKAPEQEYEKPGHCAGLFICLSQASLTREGCLEPRQLVGNAVGHARVKLRHLAPLERIELHDPIEQPIALVDIIAQHLGKLIVARSAPLGGRRRKLDLLLLG